MARGKGETEQVKEMFNLDEEQTALKTLATDTCDSHSGINSLEDIVVTREHLNW